MQSKKWLAAIFAAVVTVGVIAPSAPAYADPIGNGGVAQIATAAVNGVRYCAIPTGELRACATLTSPAGRYTFFARTCWSTALLCYEIRTSFGECLYHDIELTKIGYGSCNNTSLRYRWRLDEVNAFGTIRLRPASHTTRCAVYDPARLPAYPYTFIEECSSRPASHAWFRLLSA